MRKASAVTISIFIMMTMLASLLGFTAYYVDQTMVKPVVVMQDAEISLRCFFALTNMVRGEYIRQSELVPVDSLRSKLVDTYQISEAEQLFLGVYEDLYLESLATSYGESEIVIQDELVFWNAVSIYNLPVTCYFNVYGPVRVGTVGLFTEEAISRVRRIPASPPLESVTDLMNRVEANLYG